MSNDLARLEMAIITSRLSRSYVKKFVTSNMGGEFLKGGVLDVIRAERLSEVSGDTVFVFGAGSGNDLAFIPKDKVRQVIGIDIKDKYKTAFLQKASELKLNAVLEVGDVLDKNFAQNLLSKYGRPQSIVIAFTLCCIRRPYKSLRVLKELLADQGNIFIIEHVVNLSDIEMFHLQQKIKDDWMVASGGVDTGGCDVTMDLVTVAARSNLLIDDLRVYKDNALYLKLAAFQQPIVSIKAH